jgi:hypothetical protein
MPMDLSRIEKLLERYWNCVSTVEEEEELRAFFNGKSGNDLPDELKEAAGYSDILKANGRQRLMISSITKLLQKSRIKRILLYGRSTTMSGTTSKLRQFWSAYLSPLLFSEWNSLMATSLKCYL